MTHLTDDQLYHLAELSNNAELLNAEEEKQLDHIKSCRECFNKYCVMATLMDATRLSCGLVFAPDALQVREKAIAPAKRLLASLRITYQHLEDKITLVGEQIQQNLSAFAFEPVLATAVRGGGAAKTMRLRMEDIDDEGSYFVYDAESHKILLQFSSRNNAPETIKAYLIFNDQSIIDIPLEQNGSYLRGIVSDIPSKNFEVRIEKI